MKHQTACIRQPPRNSEPKIQLKKPKLSEFIRKQLDSTKKIDIIKWVNESQRVFKFTDKESFARAWGKEKNNPKMDYPKMARALRYYYKDNKIQKVKGQPLTYKFSNSEE